MNSANDAYQDFASQFLVFDARACSSKLQQYPKSTSASRVDLHVLYPNMINYTNLYDVT